MSKLLQDISIGGNLQRLRKAKGYTQAQLCAQMQILGRPMLQSTLTQIENGKRNIFISDLLVLKQILGASYEELFAGLSPLSKF